MHLKVYTVLLVLEYNVPSYFFIIYLFITQSHFRIMSKNAISMSVSASVYGCVIDFDVSMRGKIYDPLMAYKVKCA